MYSSFLLLNITWTASRILSLVTSLAEMFASCKPVAPTDGLTCTAATPQDDRHTQPNISLKLANDIVPQMTMLCRWKHDAIIVYQSSYPGWIRAWSTYNVLAADGSDLPESSFPKTCAPYSAFNGYTRGKIGSDDVYRVAHGAPSNYAPYTTCVWVITVPKFGLLTFSAW